MEKLLSRLIFKELKLAKEEEHLKQQLACRYDFNLELLFKAIDDWNYKYIDQVNLKRFLIKCSVLPNQNLLISIIRRIDLDADAKLNFREFIDAIRPFENFTMKKCAKPTVSEIRMRPKSSQNRDRRSTRKLDQSIGNRTYTNLNLSPDQADNQRSILKKSATNDRLDKHSPADNRGRQTMEHTLQFSYQELSPSQRQ